MGSTGPTGKILQFSSRCDKAPSIIEEIDAAGIPCAGFTEKYTQAEPQTINEVGGSGRWLHLRVWR